MKKGILAVLLICFSASAFCQTIGFVFSRERKQVKIPVEISNHLVIIPVVVNKTLPLKFILDTGVRSTILTEKRYSELLGLVYTRHFTIMGPGKEKIVDAYIAPNVTLDLPGVQGTGHAIVVLDQDFLNLPNYLGTEVHGVLGYELFNRFVIKIDYDKKFIKLIDNKRFKAPRKYKELPITIEDTKPFVALPVTMGNGDQLLAKLLIDSGASNSLILEEDSHASITIPENTITGSIGRGVGGEIFGEIGKIKELDVANYKLSNPIAYFPHSYSYIDSLKFFDNVYRNGSVGGEILSRFKVIFDFRNEKIYLKKGADFSRRFVYDLSGITIKALGPRLNVYQIEDVREGSPAAFAGITTGEFIVGINGIPTRQLNYNEITGMLNLRIGEELKLQLTSNGVSRIVSFKLEDRLANP